MKNKIGIIQIILSYIVLWIPIVLNNVQKKLNIDILLICIMLSLLIMTDAKMKYENKIVNVNFFVMLFLGIGIIFVNVIIF